METKGITCKIPLDLHNRISEEIRETESTISKFIEMVIMEHYEKGAVKVMEKGRTLPKPTTFLRPEAPSPCRRRSICRRKSSPPW